MNNPYKIVKSCLKTWIRICCLVFRRMLQCFVNQSTKIVLCYLYMGTSYSQNYFPCRGGGLARSRSRLGGFTQSLPIARVCMIGIKYIRVEYFSIVRRRILRLFFAKVRLSNTVREIMLQKNTLNTFHELKFGI